jgi:membrane associated rhomboid family serine protease
MGIIDDLKITFSRGSSLIRLIYINAGIFLLVTLGSITGYLLNNQSISQSILNLLSIPSSISSFILRPWTLITYMFMHKDIFHILFNMLWLYWFGIIFLEYLDQKKLVAVYLLGGISGAVVYMISFNIFPVYKDVVAESVAIGASASVLAIVIAIAAYVPDYSVNLFLLGRIKIKWVAIVIFILTSLMDFSVNSGGKLAHMGGALFGYLYTINLRRGFDLGKGINKFLDFITGLFKPRKNLRVTYKKKSSDYEYNKARADHQEQINKILDKISKGGYDSLTKDEKDLLFSESKKKK